MSDRVYIGLGSNLDQPQQQIKTAVGQLHELAKSRYIKDSGLYKSRPMGPQDQPDYFNAVALIETQLTAIELLDELQVIETRQGRVRTQHWGPRRIDLDILLYGDQQISTERLQVPHPGLCEREFVLYPLLRLDDALNIPGRGKLSEIIKSCSENGLEYCGEIA